MKIAIDILTIQRDRLLKDIESKIQTRNGIIKSIATIEEQMDKELERLVSINKTIEFLENNE